MATEPTNLKDAIIYFADADNCLNYLVARRWTDGVVVCPTCGRKYPRYIAERKVMAVLHQALRAAVLGQGRNRL